MIAREWVTSAVNDSLTAIIKHRLTPGVPAWSAPFLRDARVGVPCFLIGSRRVGLASDLSDWDVIGVAGPQTCGQLVLSRRDGILEPFGLWRRHAEVKLDVFFFLPTPFALEFMRSTLDGLRAFADSDAARRAELTELGEYNHALLWRELGIPFGHGCGGMEGVHEVVDTNVEVSFSHLAPAPYGGAW